MCPRRKSGGTICRVPPAIPAKGRPYPVANKYVVQIASVRNVYYFRSETPANHAVYQAGNQNPFPNTFSIADDSARVSTPRQGHLVNVRRRTQDYSRWCNLWP